MDWIRSHAKFIVAAIAPVTLAIQAASTDGTITSQEWWQIGITALVALGVIQVPNRTTTRPVV